jgi:cation diffusion facilitator family transporter
MHIHTLDQWEHTHNFLGDQAQAEKRTKTVMALTAITMVMEIIAGTAFGSIALLADGWHMATHVAAFGIVVFAYQYARRHTHNPKYTFGTGKVSVLGGFASAVGLAVIALVMALESIARFFQPQTILFNEAISVAIVGLAVNLTSAVLLQDHHHHHDSDQEHHHDDTPDHNLQAAYLHVMADALTSILAILALFAGKFWGWVWMDAVMGLVGAGVITKWAYGLVSDTSSILLDGASNKQTRLEITTALEAEGDTCVVDLHTWYVSQHHLAATVTLVTHDPQPPDHYKTLLDSIPSLAHVVVEVNRCQGEPCVALNRS